MTTKTDNHAEEQAAAQYMSICAMLDAVDVDYDRLQELKDERDELGEALAEAEAVHAEACRSYASSTHAHNKMREAAAALDEWLQENGDEMDELSTEAGDCEDEDDARQRISEDPLEVTVRSGWVSMGEEMEADEFQILLCTGGPAVRIMGELDHHGTPCRAWMEYQDWGTPWTQYFGAEHARLIAYAQHFFG
jgi:hypothetical protein